MNQIDKSRERVTSRLMVTIAEACEMLGVKRTTFYEFTRCGKIRTVPIGPRGVRIPVAELERFVATGLGDLESA